MPGVCNACSGTGQVACPTCHGRGHTGFLDASHHFHMNLCALCGSSGHLTCRVCNGSGVIGTGMPGKVAPVSAQPHLDPLAGHWTSPDGTWYDFVREGDHYSATGGSGMIRSVKGTAALEGQTVKVDLKNFLFQFHLDFTLQGEQIQGEKKVLGVPVRLTYHRV
jgi:hypothetical protein